MNSFMRGDHFDYWTGIVSGLARMGIVSRGGKATSFTGLTAGAWFGEGTVLKNEARRYDVVALRDTRIAIMDRNTFFWLFEHSAGFNRFLVRQLNVRDCKDTGECAEISEITSVQRGRK